MLDHFFKARRRLRALELAVEMSRTHDLGTAETMTLAYTFAGWINTGALPNIAVAGQEKGSICELVPASPLRKKFA